MRTRLASILLAIGIVASLSACDATYRPASDGDQPHHPADGGGAGGM